MDQRSNESSLAEELPPLSADPLVIISIIGAHDDAWLHYRPEGFAFERRKRDEGVVPAGLGLAGTQGALSAAHLLFAPLPALLTWLFPGTASTLHRGSPPPVGGNVAADSGPCYDLFRVNAAINRRIV